jgi:predicted Zn-dependent peptidase
VREMKRNNKTKKRSRGIVIFVIITFFAFIPDILMSGVTNASDYLEKNVVKRKLKNGITVVMLNRGFAPTLAFEVTFRVGSVDETYKTIGAAHLLEHMLFKGTDKIGTRNFKKEKKLLAKIEAVGETIDKLKLNNPGNQMIPELEKKLRGLQEEHGKLVVNAPYDRIYTENGGVGFNASTSRDKTGYYVQLPSSKLELWAKLESERLRNPVMREFYLERNNVIEERLMRYSTSGDGALFEKFIATAFTAHPYRHPTIGWGSNIPHLSLRDIKNFYNKHYIPSRMTITIVGKQDTDKTFKIIEKAFSSIKSRPEPTGVAIREPVVSGEKRFIYRFESNPYLVIGWHKPSFPSRYDYIFDIVSEVLSGGKSSRLYRSLVLERKIVTSIKTWNGSPGARFNNLFVVYAVPRSPHSPEEVEKAIYEEMAKLSESINRKDLEKVLVAMESEMVFGLETNKGIARILSYYQTIFRDWKYLLNYNDVLGSVKIDEIKEAMAKYFTKKNRIVGILRDSRKKK